MIRYFTLYMYIIMSRRIYRKDLLCVCDEILIQWQ